MSDAYTYLKTTTYTNINEKFYTGLKITNQDLFIISGSISELWLNMLLITNNMCHFH